MPRMGLRDCHCPLKILKNWGEIPSPVAPNTCTVGDNQHSVGLWSLDYRSTAQIDHVFPSLPPSLDTCFASTVWQLIVKHSALNMDVQAFVRALLSMLWGTYLGVGP